LSRKLTLALDYDLTFTADPECFKSIIRCFQSVGHEVFIVTLRGPQDIGEGDFFEELNEKYGVETIFCDGEAKEKVVHSRNIGIDIWIDDNPRGIIEGSPMTNADIIQWRIDNNIPAVA
jgi:hypothetical protein